MAKHGKKRIYFDIIDLKFAQFFLDFINRKQFPASVTVVMKPTEVIECSIAGSHESVKFSIRKIKKLYEKAKLKYFEDSGFINKPKELIDRQLDPAVETEAKGKNKADLKLNLIKLKFDET